MIAKTGCGRFSGQRREIAVWAQFGAGKLLGARRFESMS
jgi:hypothetical protein